VSPKRRLFPKLLSCKNSFPCPSPFSLSTYFLWTSPIPPLLEGLDSVVILLSVWSLRSDDSFCLVPPFMVYNFDRVFFPNSHFPSLIDVNRFFSLAHAEKSPPKKSFSFPLRALCRLLRDVFFPEVQPFPRFHPFTSSRRRDFLTAGFSEQLRLSQPFS